MAKSLNFTKSAIEGFPLPRKGGRDYYRDSGGSKSVRGLGLVVTGAGTKSFHVIAYISGSTRRVGFAKFPDCTIENARKKAKNLLSDIANGENPIQRKKVNDVASVSLREVFANYVNSRKSLKPGTIYDYEKALNESFSDWLDKPIRNITKEMVRTRHTKRGKQSPARANNAMRVLRALFNFAQEVYEDERGDSLFQSNPVAVLSKTKAWHVINRRKTYIKKTDLPKWFETVRNYENISSTAGIDVVKDYLQFVLFTGCRRYEAESLRWGDIDLKQKVFTLTDTKNQQIVTLPYSDYVHEILQKREAETVGEFVFPGTGVAGHIIDIRKQILHIRELSGVEFTIHDLRRTFLTIAESLDISLYTLKRLVNHKTGEKADVTAGYIVVDIERLRKATQRVTDCILETVGFREGNIISITKRAMY